MTSFNEGSLLLHLILSFIIIKFRFFWFYYCNCYYNIFYHSITENVWNFELSLVFIIIICDFLEKIWKKYFKKRDSFIHSMGQFHLVDSVDLWIYLLGKFYLLYKPWEAIKIPENYNFGNRCCLVDRPIQTPFVFEVSCKICVVSRV